MLIGNNWFRGAWDAHSSEVPGPTSANVDDLCHPSICMFCLVVRTLFVFLYPFIWQSCVCFVSYASLIWDITARMLWQTEEARRSWTPDSLHRASSLCYLFCYLICLVLCTNNFKNTISAHLILELFWIISQQVKEKTKSPLAIR